MSLVLIIADREGRKQVAISRGLELAAKMGWGAQVVGFVFEDLAQAGIKNASERAAIKKKLLATRRASLESALADHKKTSESVRVAITPVWEKSIHLWVDKQCARKQYAAVIKTGRRTETFVYTPTDWHLLRECPAPVIIVAAKKWHSTKPIVATVDLTASSRMQKRLNDEVVQTAKRYAQSLNCDLFVLHALSVPAVLTELDLVDEHSHVKKLAEEMQPRLHQLANKHSLPVSHVILKHGPVEKVITSEAARLKAQLVVMGTIGRSGLKAKLIGNTAEKVLNTLRTDVLAIKPWL